MNVSKTLNYLKNGGIYVVLFILLMIIIIKEPSFLALFPLRVGEYFNSTR